MKCDRCWLDDKDRRALFSCGPLNLCLSHAMLHRSWGHKPKLLPEVARQLLAGEW